MNRHERRKLSRHATNDEIFPEKHGPVQPEIASQMTATLKALKAIYGDNYEITLFIAERKATADRARPRFNYGSTAARRDMYAVLRAFLAKNEALGDALDKIEDEPPTGQRQ